jgi:SAM-dependent methyltransferase
MPSGKLDFATVGISRREAARILAASIVGANVAAPLLIGQDRQPMHEPDVPFVPTTEEAVEAMLKLANVTKNDVVYDLGCGDGRIVIAAAKTYGAKAVGIDIDPVRIDEAKANAKKAGVEDKVRFEENDLFKADFHEATVVTLFLLNSVNLRLRPRLIEQLKPGTRVVSNTFDMGDWTPVKDITIDAPDEAFLSRRFFLWVVPEKK